MKRRLLALVATAMIVIFSGCQLCPTDDVVVCNKRKDPTCRVLR
jgi:hypothetical protein